MKRLKRLAALLAPVLVAATATAALSGPAHATDPTPAPAALAGSTYVQDWSLSTLSSPPWTAPTNNPGNCPANPGAVSLSPDGYVDLHADGTKGNCTSIQSPDLMPTAPGYVYEAKIQVTNAANWPAMWAYGPNWPSQGEIDAMEFNDQLNAVSWHQSGTGRCTSEEYSTNPWTYSCKQNLTPEPGTPNFTAGQWITVDYAFTSDGVNVYYDGQLYAHVPQDITTSGNDPMYLTFSNGSCAGSHGANVCLNRSDAKAVGDLQVAYFREFS